MPAACGLTSRSTRTLLGGASRRPSSRRLAWFVRAHAPVIRLASSMNVWAVTIGIVTMVVVYGGATFVLNLMIHRPTDNPSLWILLAPIFSMVLWLLPGFMTGYI